MAFIAAGGTYLNYLWLQKSGHRTTYKITVAQSGSGIIGNDDVVGNQSGNIVDRYVRIPFRKGDIWLLDRAIIP
jgi:hypothetical protein